MSIELKWLIYTIIFTSLTWLPYILNRIVVRGLGGAMGYEANQPHAEWAERAMKAHSNAVENLVLFAPAVLVLHQLGISTETTAMAAMVYFATRVIHYVTYVFKIPVLRTLSFFAAWGAILVLAIAALGS